MTSIRPLLFLTMLWAIACKPSRQLPEDGLILHLPFDGGYEDLSSVGHFAELLHDQDTVERFVPGKFGKAIQFYNDDNYEGGEMVRTSTSEAISQMVKGGKATLSLWANHTTDRYEQAYLGISAIHGGPKKTGSHFYIKVWHDGEIRALSAHSREEVWGIARSDTGQYVPGEWFHLAVTVDGADVHLFKNGERVAPPYIAPPSWIEQIHANCELNDLRLPDECRIYVGGRAGEWGGFEGKIDQVRVYNRVLSDADILALAAE
ncbi:LamG domain-containing protein [Marinoscillum furvescens]|uniref:Concanavalin A-like lectin/glucanase superfamily protein n=1 Tax=Marinoscillum furvescens DSM 4134 TaxID=1122208 RepID=A0A3D9KZF6_MARFU|nr:LamG domain-containing protein [Marinoscillum furvescens]RED95672.1 concanavalin A-like lectin/glucanase superfamily protein [Marinoscillum furvescens DSM 4134]